MLALGRLLGLVAVRRSLSDNPLIHQFLVRAGACVGMLIVASFLIGALLVGGLFMAYGALLAHGLTPDASMVAVVGITLLLVVILLQAISAQFHRMHHMVHDIVRSQAPLSGVTDAVSDMADAFMRGFNSSSRSTPRLVKKDVRK